MCALWLTAREVTGHFTKKERGKGRGKRVKRVLGGKGFT